MMYKALVGSNPRERGKGGTKSRGKLILGKWQRGSEASPRTCTEGGASKVDLYRPSNSLPGSQQARFGSRPLCHHGTVLRMRVIPSGS